MAITIHNRHRILGREWWTTEWAGLSTDDKATIEDVKVNDLFFEEDTGDFYYCESQGSKGSQEEKVVLEETTLDNWAGGANPNTFVPTMLTELPQTATIIWDGVSYDVTKETYTGMSYYGELGDNYNPIYSTYPFFLVLSNIPDEGDVFIIRTLEAVDHTIEIIAVVGTPDTDAVWKKVGSGGSTQTELPKITISMTPNKTTTVVNNVNCFYDGNYPVCYDKYGNAIDIATWDDMISFNANETKTVIAYAKENEGIYDTCIGFCITNFISATSSNEVNCTYADGIIEVTDPTQEASITLAVSINLLG